MAMTRLSARHGSTPRQRGFTLVEMMVTIAVAAILLAIVVPSFITFTLSQRVKSGSFDVYSTLMVARSEAVKRRANVTVTAKSGNWNNGWTLSNGASGNQDAPKGLNITSDATSLTYQLDGRLSSGSASYLELAATGSTAAGRRCITIDPTGVPRSRALTGSATCP
jgi:type IV fimbrial biogenesis protein FimT